MKNKRKTMIIAMLSCVVLLVAAGFVNAAGISGYSDFKNGVRNTLNLRNATVNLSTRIVVDGVLDESNKVDIFAQVDLDNGIRYTKENGYEEYQVKDTAMDSNYAMYTVYHVRNNDVYSYGTSSYGMGQFDSLSRMEPEWIRVIELLGDALSGNTKDYFFTTRNGGAKTVTANLAKEQVPEIVSAVINLVRSSACRYTSESTYTPNPYNTPSEELQSKMECGFIKQIDVMYVNINLDMDENDYITNGKVDFTVLITDKAGKANEVVLTVAFSTTDIGTTTVTIPESVIEKALAQHDTVLIPYNTDMEINTATTDDYDNETVKAAADEDNAETSKETSTVTAAETAEAATDETVADTVTEAVELSVAATVDQAAEAAAAETTKVED